MELQELKNKWEALDKRIEENVTLNQALLAHTLRNEAKTSIKRLFNSSIAVMIFSAVGLFVCKLALHKTPFPEIVIIAAGATIFSIIWNIVFVYKLNKLSDVDSTTYINLKRVVKFELLYKYSLWTGYFVAALFFIAIIYILRYNYIVMGISIVAFIIAACVGLMVDKNLFKEVKRLKSTLKEINDM